jgi:hypothetical protein
VKTKKGYHYYFKRSELVESSRLTDGARALSPVMPDDADFPLDGADTRFPKLKVDIKTRTASFNERSQTYTAAALSVPPSVGKTWLRSIFDTDSWPLTSLPDELTAWFVLRRGQPLKRSHDEATPRRVVARLAGTPPPAYAAPVDIAELLKAKEILREFADHAGRDAAHDIATWANHGAFFRMCVAASKVSCKNAEHGLLEQLVRLERCYTQLRGSERENAEHHFYSDDPGRQHGVGLRYLEWLHREYRGARTPEARSERLPFAFALHKPMLAALVGNVSIVRELCAVMNVPEAARHTCNGLREPPKTFVRRWLTTLERTATPPEEMWVALADDGTLWMQNPGAEIVSWRLIAASTVCGRSVDPACYAPLADWFDAEWEQLFGALQIVKHSCTSYDIGACGLRNVFPWLHIKHLAKIAQIRELGGQ